MYIRITRVGIEIINPKVKYFSLAIMEQAYFGGAGISSR
jgi:hypothetical protein